jgi:hypothetical protein
MKPDKPTEDGHRRKGDRLSTRRHGRKVREFVARREVAPAARVGADIVEPRREQAGRADRKVRRGPRATRVTVDELVAKGRTVIDRIEALVHRVADRIGSRRARRGRKPRR